MRRETFQKVVGLWAVVESPPKHQSTPISQRPPPPNGKTCPIALPPMSHEAPLMAVPGWRDYSHEHKAYILSTHGSDTPRRCPLGKPRPSHKRSTHPHPHLPQLTRIGFLSGFPKNDSQKAHASTILSEVFRDCASLNETSAVGPLQPISLGQTLQFPQVYGKTSEKNQR